MNNIPSPSFKPTSSDKIRRITTIPLSHPCPATRPNRALYGSIFFIIVLTILMAARLSVSLSRSLHSPSPPCYLQPFCLNKRTILPFPKSIPKRLLKSPPCPLWSSSFSLCLNALHWSTKTPPQPITVVRSFTYASLSKSTVSEPTPQIMSSSVEVNENNPLLKDFDFPPFDAIEAVHVRPGIRGLLKQLDRELEELERTVEPTWLKLVEPLEKIVDRLNVVWGAVNHLKSVKDTAELRAAIEEVQVLANCSLL